MAKEWVTLECGSRNAHELVKEKKWGNSHFSIFDLSISFSKVSFFIKKAVL